MQTMYPAQAFSPTTALAASITATDTTIPVVDLSKLPPAPNLVTIGEGLEAETILYTGTDANTEALTGVTRGFQGTARSWEAGTPIARLLTAYDHDAFKSNIEEVSQRIATHEEAADPHPQYAPDEHEHEMADVQGLQAALDNKASKSHTHTLAQITDAGTAAARNVEDFATPSSVEEVRGIAEAAQAAADAAQETADAALSTAQAAGQAAVTAKQTANAAQQAAEGAQAAAVAAQETADTAQQTANSASTAITNHINAVSAAHPASAISNTPAGNITATTVQDAINKLDSEKAGKNQANTWTQRQTFAAGITDGDSNTDVSLIYSVQHQAHTRSTVLTYTDGRLTKVEEKDGSTVVKTTTLNYDGNGRLSSVVETAGGVSRTSTLNYDVNGNLTSVTRS